MRKIKFKVIGGSWWYLPVIIEGSDCRDYLGGVYQFGGATIEDATANCQARFGADYQPIGTKSDIDAGELATMPAYDC